MNILFGTRSLNRTQEQENLFLDLEKQEKDLLERKEFLKTGSIHQVGNVEAWIYQGKLHRESGPAWYDDKKSYWYYHGQQHRVDGPAVEHIDGHREYWLKGKLHREDGPAVEYKTGKTEYWVNGNLK